jgi:hypothetical protein
MVALPSPLGGYRKPAKRHVGSPIRDRCSTTRILDRASLIRDLARQVAEDVVDELPNGVERVTVRFHFSADVPGVDVRSIG